MTKTAKSTIGKTTPDEMLHHLWQFRHDRGPADYQRGASAEGPDRVADLIGADYKVEDQHRMQRLEPDTEVENVPPELMLVTPVSYEQTLVSPAGDRVIGHLVFYRLGEAEWMPELTGPGFAATCDVATITAANGIPSVANLTFSITWAGGGTATLTIPVSDHMPGEDAVVRVYPGGSSSIEVITWDDDGDAVSLSVATQPAHGTVTINDNGTVDYQANAGYTGSESFVVAASDGRGGVTVKTITVSVVEMPNVGPDVQLLTPTVYQVNIGGPSGAVLGTLTMREVGPGQWEPSLSGPGFTAVAATSIVSVSNGVPDVQSLAFNLSWANGSTSQFARNTADYLPGSQANLRVVRNSSVVAIVAGSDGDGDRTTLSVSGQPAHGTATVDQQGTVSYTPAPGYTGTDSFVVAATDGLGAVGYRTITVSVVPPAVQPLVLVSPTADGSNLEMVEPNTISADADGNLVDQNGAFLVSWPHMPWDNSAAATTFTLGGKVYMLAYVDDNGRMVYVQPNELNAEHLRAINLKDFTGDAYWSGGTQFTATGGKVAMSMNLDARSGTGASAPFSLMVDGHAIAGAWVKTGINTWAMSLVPDAGMAVLSAKDRMGNVVCSGARIDLTGVPAAGTMTVSINGADYHIVIGAGIDDATTLHIDTSGMTAADAANAIDGALEAIASASGSTYTVSTAGDAIIITQAGGSSEIDLSGMETVVSSAGEAVLDAPSVVSIPASIGGSAVVFDGSGLPMMGVDRIDVAWDTGATSTVGLDIGSILDAGGLTQFAGDTTARNAVSTHAIAFHTAGEFSQASNLDAETPVGGTVSTSVRTWDSLGIQHDLRITFEKTGAGTWQRTIETPTGQASVTLRNELGDILASAGRLDFTSAPTSGEMTVKVAAAYYTVRFEAGTDTADTLFINPASLGSASDTASAVAAAITQAYQTTVGDGVVVARAAGSAVLLTGSTAGDIQIMGLDGVLAGSTPAITQAANDGASILVNWVDNPGDLLTFAPDGSLNSAGNYIVTVDLTNGARDQNGSNAIRLDLSGLTQASAETTLVYGQDGAPAAALTGFRVASDGMVVGITEAGVERPLFGLPSIMVTDLDAYDRLLNGDGGAWANITGLHINLLPSVSDLHSNLSGGPIAVADAGGAPHSARISWLAAVSAGGATNYDAVLTPPAGAQTAALLDSQGLVYAAAARLDFGSVPTGGHISLTANGQTWTVVLGPGSNGTPTNTLYVDPAVSGSFGTQVGAAINTALTIAQQGVTQAVVATGAATELTLHTSAGDVVLTVDTGSLEMMASSISQQGSQYGLSAIVNGSGLSILRLYDQAPQQSLTLDGTGDLAALVGTSVPASPYFWGTGQDNSVVIYQHAGDVTIAGLDTIVGATVAQAAAGDSFVLPGITSPVDDALTMDHTTNSATAWRVQDLQVDWGSQTTTEDLSLGDLQGEASTGFAERLGTLALPLHVSVAAGQTVHGYLANIANSYFEVSYSIVDAPDHGTLTIVDPATGEFTYTGGAGYAGNDSFSYKVTDAFGVETVLSRTVTVGGTLAGSQFNDAIGGSAGIDILLGGMGQDVLHGNGGNDILDGGTGTNILDGGVGDDILVSRGYHDLLIGGTGADTFRLTALHDGTAAGAATIADLNEGEGDTIDLSAFGGVFRLVGTADNRVALQVGTGTSVAGQDTTIGAWSTVAVLDNAHTNGALNGDGAAQAISQAALNAEAQRLQDAGVIIGAQA